MLIFKHAGTITRLTKRSLEQCAAELAASSASACTRAHDERHRLLTTKMRPSVSLLLRIFRRARGRASLQGTGFAFCRQVRSDSTIDRNVGRVSCSRLEPLLPAQGGHDRHHRVHIRRHHRRSRLALISDRQGVSCLGSRQLCSLQPHQIWCRAAGGAAPRHDQVS